MGMSACNPIGRRLLWIGAMTIAGAIVASIGMSIVQLAAALLSGRSLAGVPLLQSGSDRYDLFFMLVVPALLALDCVRRGWSDSAICRLLTRETRRTAPTSSIS